MPTSKIEIISNDSLQSILAKLLRLSGLLWNN